MSFLSYLDVLNSQDDLRARFYDRAAHPQALTRLTGHALRDGEADAAFALADRRCRILPMAEARDYLLRAEAARRLGRYEAAAADVRRALEIDPTDVLVNARFLETLDDDTQRAARAIVAMPTAATSALRPAIAACVAQGDAIVAHLAPVGEHLTGFVTWPENTGLVCRVTRSGQHDTFTLRADPSHPLATADRQAAACRVSRHNGETITVSFTGFGLGDHGPIFHFASDHERELAATMSGAPADPACDLTVIVPVYEDYERTVRCLDSLAAQVLPNGRWTTIVVDDASPNQHIAADLRRRAEAGTIRLITQTANRGFAASVNAAGLTAGGDILLLNSDTLLPPDSLRRLRDALHSEPTIGTVTPLSNNGEQLSFPNANTVNPMPDEAGLQAWDRAAARQAGRVVDIPNGIGFCLMIARACWTAVGGVPLVYGRGYFEDVDLCLRARELGYRNVCATNLIVGHAGSSSFQASKRALVVHNLKTLEVRYPTYREDSAAFSRANPLESVFGRIEASLPQPHDILLVTGDTPDHVTVKRRSSILEAEGRRVLILGPASRPGRFALRSASTGVPQSLSFPRCGVGAAKLIAYLKSAGISRVELMMPLVHDDDFLALLDTLALPIDLHLSEPVGRPLRPRRPVEPSAAGRPICPDPEPAIAPTSLDRFDRIHCSDAMARGFAASRFPHRAVHMSPSTGCERPIDPRGIAEHGRSRIVAVLCPVAHATVTTLVSALMRRQVGQPADLSVVVIGTTLDDFAIMAMGSTFVTGVVKPDEYGTVLAGFAPDALLLPYRDQLFHTFESARCAVPCPGMYFDWSCGGYRPAIDDLVLNPAICDDEAARQIVAWLGLPIRSQ